MQNATAVNRGLTELIPFTLIGLSSMIMVIGQIGGPLLAGAFADWTGNYRTGFTILAVLAGVGSLFFLLAKPPKQT